MEDWDMNMQCKLCNKEFEIGRLQIHLKTIHKQNLEEYYIKNINPNYNKKCLICNNKTKFISFSKLYNDNKLLNFLPCYKKSYYWSTKSCTNLYPLILLANMTRLKTALQGSIFQNPPT